MTVTVTRGVGVTIVVIITTLGGDWLKLQTGGVEAASHTTRAWVDVAPSVNNRDVLGENEPITQVAISSMQETEVTSGAVLDRPVSEPDNFAESAWGLTELPVLSG